MTCFLGNPWMKRNRSEGHTKVRKRKNIRKEQEETFDEKVKLKKCR